MQQDHPKSAPPSVFDELLASPLLLLPASKGQRFANCLIDSITFYIGFSAVSLALLSFGQLGFIFKLGNLGFSTLLLLLLAAYYFVLEVTTGRTLGKLFTRTRVIMKDGTRPTAGAIMQRSLCRLIPFEAFSFFGRGQGMHDRLSKTMVVKLD